MRVYIIGNHSNGKSTLASYVSKTYNLKLIPEVARTILYERELNIDSLRNNIDFVDSYQEEVILRQLEEEKKYKEFVSDRSFDALAYAAQHSRVLMKIIRLPEFKAYIDALKQSDVRLFFIRPSKSIMKEDGVRETPNWDSMVQIDAMIKFMIELFELDYFQINMDNMQERIRFVDSILKIK